MQTKSGSNQYHGSVFEFWQGDNFEARNPFTQFQADPNTGKFIPDTSKNQYGGTFGGKIIEDKTFFFGAFQGQRANQGGSQLLTVPTAAARNGDLSAYGVNIYDPAGLAAPNNRPQFAGNVIPTGRLSPQAQNILKLIPMPNAAGTDGGTRNNYVANGVESFHADQYDVRIDHRIDNSSNLFGRYSLAKFLRDGPTAFGQGGGAALVSLGGVSDVKNQSLALGYDKTLSPTLLMDVRFGWFQYHVNVTAVRLRDDAVGGRGDSRAEPGQELHQRSFGLLRQRRSRIQRGLWPRRQPLQLPAGRGREAVADRRQPHEDLEQPHVQGRRGRAARLQPARAERLAPLWRAELQRGRHARADGRRIGSRDVPAGRRLVVRPLRQQQHGCAGAAVAALLLRRRTRGARRRS